MIVVLGVSHKTAPLEIREKYAFSTDEVGQFSRTVLDRELAKEIVILSTCNRTEIYFKPQSHHHSAIARSVYELLCQFKSINIDEMNYFFRYSNEEAIEHLFAVCSGLDSMVVGEDQIIGQAKEAYDNANKTETTGAFLKRLFQKAFEAGKRVRTETGIKSGTTSVSHLAVELCKETLTSLQHKTALVIGAGQAAELIVQSLHKQNIGKLYIANRTLSKAQLLADKYKGTALELVQIKDFLNQCDCIISATASESVMLSHPDFKQENNSPVLRVVVDISVPHNVDKKINELSFVKLFLVDDLQGIIKANTEKRMSYIGPARKIIQEVSADFMEWNAAQSLQPAIHTITSILKEISEKELLSFPKECSPESQKNLQEYSEHLARKYTRHFIKNLKNLSKNSDADYIDLVSNLFKHQ